VVHDPARHPADPDVESTLSDQFPDVVQEFSPTTVTTRTTVRATRFAGHREPIADDGTNTVTSIPAAGIIETNTLDVQALLGNIGEDGDTVQRLNVDLVVSRSYDGVFRPSDLTASAPLGDIFLNLKGHLRDPQTTEFVVDITSIISGGTTDILLQQGVRRPVASAISIIVRPSIRRIGR
jgi:hypothetical protein